MADGSLNVADTIRQVASQYGVDPDFALRIGQAESALNPAAVSPKGAVGPMQLMPKTAASLGVDPHDVRQNIVGGIKNIRQLQDRFGNNEELIAAAYNAGPGAVEKHGGVPPYPETQDYVQRVTGIPQQKKLDTSSLDQVFGISRPVAAVTLAETPAISGVSLDQGALNQAFGFGVTAPAKAVTPPPMATRGLGAAQAEFQRQARADWLAQHPGVLNVANAAALNTIPVITGAGAAAATGIQNALANIGLGKRAPYSMGEAYAAGRGGEQGIIEAYQQAHPYANVAEQIAGFAAGGPAKLAAKAGEGALARLAPQVVATGAGRVAARLAGVGTAGAAVGAGSAASRGQGAAGILQGAAETGLTSVPFGLAGEAIGAAAPRIPARAIAVPAAGAALGAGAAALTGQDPRAYALQGAGLGLIASGGRRPNAAIEATPAQRGRALDIVKAQTTPESLETAHPALTTLEAMGEAGQKIAKTAGGAGNPPEAVTEAINARQDKSAVMDRVSAGLQAATGIAPETAKLDAQAQVDAARAGPAKTAYEAALTGKGIWTPKLAQLAAEPEVATAMNQARRLLGSGAFAPNPAAETEAAFPPSMSSAELRSRMTQAGKVAPGQEVTTNDLMEYLKKGGPTTYSLVPKTPAEIPTDRMWDLTKQLLDKGVKYNAFGKPEPSSENHLQQHWAGEVRDATDEAIPGLRAARDISGDYLSFQQARGNGEDLWGGGKNAETGASFAERYAKLSPAEQRATQMGYLAKAHAAAERGDLNLQKAQSPFHRSIQQTMFGKDVARQIQATFAQEAKLAQAAREMHLHLKLQPQVEAPHGGLATGMTIAAAEHGLSPSALAHGAIAGAVGSGTRGLIRSVQESAIHPGVRNALGEIGAQPPHVTAAQIRARARETNGSPAGVTLREMIAQGLLRGLAVSAAGPAAHALHGLSVVSREDRRAAP